MSLPVTSEDQALPKLMRVGRHVRPSVAEVVPRWLTWPRGGTAKVVGASKADLLLMSVTRLVPGLKGFTYLPAQDGSAAPSVAVPFKALGITAYYWAADWPLPALRGISRARIAHLQNPELAELVPLGADSGSELVSAALMTAARQCARTVDVKVLQILKGTHSLPSVAVSQTHMRHVTPKLLDCLISKHRPLLPRLSLLNTIVGWRELSEQTFVTIALYILLLPDIYYSLVELSLCWGAKDATDWVKKTKQISIACKSIQGTVGLDLTPFFEMDVLLNRGVGTVDWGQEELNRTQATRLTSHTFEEIYGQARNLFQQVLSVGAAPARLTWEAFWARRWEWATPGSVHSQHPEPYDQIHLEREEKTKWHCLSRYPTVGMSRWTSRPPEIHAWPSIKYEWGKQRAIYGTDLTGYVLSAFGFAGIEDILPPACPLGSQANAETVRARVRNTVHGLTPFCLDFDDFNSQHSNSSMKAVLVAYLHTFGKVLTEQQCEAVQWTIESLSRAIVHPYPGGSKQYEARGTLLSGWRLTTLINTVLNYAYVKLAAKGLDVPSLHSGDDVLCGVSTYRQVQLLTRRLCEKGCSLQTKKCFLGGLTEFLRVDHREADGGQYLTRATATMVHSPVETKKPYMLRGVLEAIEERCREVIRRLGCPQVVEVVRGAQLDRVAHKWNTTKEMLDDVIRTHRSSGGLSTEPTAPLENYYIDVPLSSRTDADRRNITPGARDYAVSLSNALLGGEYVGLIARKAQMALERAKGGVAYTVRAGERPSCVVSPQILRALYKYKAQTVGQTTIKTLTGLGLPIIALRTERTALKDYYLQYPAQDRAFWIGVTA